MRARNSADKRAETSKELEEVNVIISLRIGRIPIRRGEQWRSAQWSVANEELQVGLRGARRRSDATRIVRWPGAPALAAAQMLVT